MVGVAPTFLCICLQFAKNCVTVYLSRGQPQLAQEKQMNTISNLTFDEAARWEMYEKGLLTFEQVKQVSDKIVISAS